MHFFGTNVAALAVALIFAYSHVSVTLSVSAAAAPDPDSPDEQDHVIRVRSADEEEEDANEEYEEYEEEYEEDGEDGEEGKEGEEGEGRNVEMETVAKIRVVWSNDEEDLYCDDHLQAARMWGIIQGTNGEDIKYDDEDPPPSESTVFVTFPTQPPDDYIPQEALQNIIIEERMHKVFCMLQNMYILKYLGGADTQDVEKMSSFKGLKDAMKKFVFGSYSYPGIEEYESTTTEVAITIMVAPTVAGQRKKLWAVEAIDLETTTTPDYNYAGVAANIWLQVASVK